MTSISALEAKTHFGNLLRLVAQGEEIVITKHEKPVARIIPEGRRDQAAVLAAVAGLRALRARIKARTGRKCALSLTQVRSAVREGRP